MGGEGVEQGAESSEKTQSSAGSGAESGAVGPREVAADADLLAIVAAWLQLSAGVRAEIVAIVRAASRSPDRAR